MDRRQFEDLLSFYVLDAISDEEKELVETYLQEHPDARQQAEELKRSVAALPHSVFLVKPSPRSKELLMRRVTADQPSSSGRIPLENFFRVFSLGVAILAILWALVLTSQVAELRNEIAALRQALATQSDSIEQINNALPQLNASELMTVSLQGTNVQPEAQGQLIADPNSQSAILVVANLTPLESGRTYQIWLIEGDRPQSAGLLDVDETGQGVSVVTSEEEIGSFDTLGISIEPDGGSLQPTGEIVVLSNLQ